MQIGEASSVEIYVFAGKLIYSGRLCGLFFMSFS